MEGNFVDFNQLIGVEVQKYYVTVNKIIHNTFSFIYNIKLGYKHMYVN